MKATTAAMLRRVREMVGSGAMERLDPSGARLVLAQLLYDGHGVPDWHHRATCRGYDSQLFFPEPGEDAQLLAAKRICAVCPVRRPCLTDVMAWEPPGARYGVVGGLSANERRQLHRTTRDSPCGGEAA
jgi:WhiB family redox-sensing transcriptional regulator